MDIFKRYFHLKAIGSNFLKSIDISCIYSETESVKEGFPYDLLLIYDLFFLFSLLSVFGHCPHKGLHRTQAEIVLLKFPQLNREVLKKIADFFAQIDGVRKLQAVKHNL